MESKMDYGKELQKIYDSEINVSISSFWDAGMEFRLGDESNGWKWQKDFWNFEEGMKELIEAIKKFYPNNDYVKEMKK